VLTSSQPILDGLPPEGRRIPPAYITPPAILTCRSLSKSNECLVHQLLPARNTVDYVALIGETGCGEVLRSIGPNTPPTAADSAAVPRSGVDSGRFAVGMDAPLHFVLKDVNGIDVNLPQQADEQQAGRPAFSVPLQRAQHDPKGPDQN
jgi:hypothetical protein